jgi:hypothetical protein
MRSGFALAAFRKQIEFVLATLLAAGVFGAAANARSIVIDNFTEEVWGDANDGQAVALPFAVDYGSGQQSSVTVQVPDLYSTDADGLAFAAVGLTFTGSPSDALFATFLGGGPPLQVPVVMLSNETEVSRPSNPVDQASNFKFGNMLADMAPPPPGSPQCDAVGISTYCYGPYSSSVMFQFIDLSSTGTAGDFELVLECGALCRNIGFNLAGLSFSADDFDPAAPPSQLVDYSLGTSFGPLHPGTFDFVFRSAALPEPATWGSMLIGFALAGAVLRRQRKPGLLAS